MVFGMNGAIRLPVDLSVALYVVVASFLSSSAILGDIMSSFVQSNSTIKSTRKANWEKSLPTRTAHDG
jgi:hypothetical protein